jgi:hypothetical protein
MDRGSVFLKRGRPGTGRGGKRQDARPSVDGFGSGGVREMPLEWEAFKNASVDLESLASPQNRRRCCCTASHREIVRSRSLTPRTTGRVRSS